MLVALYLTVGHRVRISQWHVTPATNAALEEALMWKQGRLHLEQNDYEVARKGDRRYNVVGLAFVLLSVIGTTLGEIGGHPPGSFYGPHYAMLVALPLPIAAYAAFRTVTRSSPWAAVFAGYLIVGTPLLPVLQACQGGVHGASIYEINHVLAVTGLLIFAADLLGPRRIWPAVLGLMLAAWSRQMTMVYLPALLWLAWRHGTGDTAVHAQPAAPACYIAPSAARRRRALRIAAAGATVILAVPMTLNFLKFGNPLETGYARLYEGRTDPIGRRGQQQTFGLRYVAQNAHAMHMAFPSWSIRAGALRPETAGVDGASIWLTMPLLLGVPLTIRRWASDCIPRALLLSGIAVMAGLLTYHTSGANDAGYYRYALDFVPVWLLVIAPWMLSPRVRPWTLVALAWSALYFNLLP